jgi:hypothetical protein
MEWFVNLGNEYILVKAFPNPTHLPVPAYIGGTAKAV